MTDRVVLAKRLRQFADDDEKRAQNMRGDPEGVYERAALLGEAAAALSAEDGADFEALAIAALHAWNNIPNDGTFSWPKDFPEGSREGWRRVVKVIAGSSNGRTAHLDCANDGSNPSPASTEFAAAIRGEASRQPFPTDNSAPCDEARISDGPGTVPQQTPATQAPGDDIDAVTGTADDALPGSADQWRAELQAPGEEELREQLIADFNAYISRAIAGDGQFGAIDLAAIALRRLSSAHLTHKRWNIREDGDDLFVCRGDHHRSEGCSERRYSPADVIADLIAAAKAEERERCAKIADRQVRLAIGQKHPIHAEMGMRIVAAIRNAGGE